MRPLTPCNRHCEFDRFTLRCLNCSNARTKQLTNAAAGVGGGGGGVEGVCLGGRVGGGGCLKGGHIGE